jgi:hypothetical protein
MSSRFLRCWRVAALPALALFPLACSGGGGGGGSSGGELQITAVNLPPNFVGWELNRPIRITFSEALDPTTVNSNTINVREPNGTPAFGTPSVDPSDKKAVIWRPDCPTLDDLSDAGLQPNRVYELRIIGASQNAGFTVRSRDGDVLELSDTRTFTTPNSALFSDLFVDDAIGPPVPVIRPAGSALTDATYVLVDGVQHFFETQAGGPNTLNPPLSLPLNLLSDPATQVELFIQFNQSVDMRSSNINSSRVRWEFESAPGLWTAVTAAVSLESNCTEAGAVVRLVPEGLLPPGSNMRVVVAPEFRDIVSEQNLLPQDQFAPMDAVPPPSPLADNYLEEFNNNAREDTTAPFAEPHASWNDGGELKAKFSFTGTGGPGADFDWKISAGEIVFLNSINTTIQGGPGGIKQKSQTVVGGVVDVRDLIIEAGGVLQCDGPNPIRILASGNVQIDGLLDISGNKSPGVVSLNTTNIPEPGAAGRCGGGRGGTGSPLTTASDPKGGNGAGAFDQLDAGGEGGETGWSNAANALNQRRGAGGGGGRFGENVEANPNNPGIFVQTLIGMDGEPGFDNTEAANGAINGAGPAFGGQLGPSPFVDGNPGNDFFGTMFDTVNGQLVVGELKKPWAGAGGGAGGDASNVGPTGSFPGPWDPTGDEKGAAGGGGGGSLEILALGNIVFGATGQIVCRGGSGGGGENTIFLNRVGGGSGGGSGGHVILQTASAIDFTAVTGTEPAILATGGQGGAGKDDAGGAFRSNVGQKETAPNLDACPDPQSSTGLCLPPVPGAGGDGSPGLVQLHTSAGLVGGDILLAPGKTLSIVCSPPPTCPLGAGTVPGSCYMVPTFGRLSRARSQWVALGNGGFDATTGQFKDVTFLFDGTDPLTGDVLREPSGTTVLGLPPLLTASGIAATGRTLVMDATAMVGGPNDFYLQTPVLLEHFLVELYDSNAPTTFERFDVVSASFAALTNLLTLDLDPNGPAMDTFVSTGPVNAELQPAYFRVASDGVDDSLPTSANVSIFLSATTADSLGNPELIYGVNLDEPLVNNTPDVAALNFPANQDLRFVRFEVLFDIDALIQGLSPTSPIPSLEFMRVGFKYP